MTIYNMATDHNYYNNLSIPLLLSNKNRDGLFTKANSNSLVIIITDHIGNALAYDSQTGGAPKTFESITDLVREFLGEYKGNTNSYLVTPEMEIERIFNCLRYKYLNAIFISEIQNPQTCLSCTHNKAFQSLAGLKVYQGNPSQRKNNDSYWRDAGFTEAAKSQTWERERRELKEIIQLIKQVRATQLTEVYAELIAIKPGFHELYLHNDYFKRGRAPKGTSIRDCMLRILRGKGDKSSLMIAKMPPEINCNSYFSYAPCNVTEGPFVFRKQASISYYDEIRRIKSKRQIGELVLKFHILDYQEHDLSTREKLREFLEKAKDFRNYIHDREVVP